LPGEACGWVKVNYRIASPIKRGTTYKEDAQNSLGDALAIWHLLIGVANPHIYTEDVFSIWDSISHPMDAVRCPRYAEPNGHWKDQAMFYYDCSPKRYAAEIM
jgi:hypothetical protein